MEKLEPMNFMKDDMERKSALRDRRILLSDEVNTSSIEKVCYYLRRLRDIDDKNKIPMNKRKPIEILLNTPGGIVYEMMGSPPLMDEMKRQGYTIITTCTGYAFSCGSIILSMGSKRRMYKYSTVLIHKISSGMWGSYDDLKVSFEECKRLEGMLEDILVENTKIPKDLLLNKCGQGNWYISANDALSLGIVDEVI